MAKLSRDDRKIIRASANEEVLEIRRRFAQALAFGYTNEEAAALAHGTGEILFPEPAPVQRPAAAQPSSSKSNAPATETVNLSGGGSQPATSQPQIDIPPNWADLPWPQLKALAESRNPAGIAVTSRKQAGEIIMRAIS